jgi:hypothetical protein
MWWERDEREPAINFYPAIITFLGYEPWPEPQTLAEALLAERRRRGLAVEKVAELTGIDPGTWLRWEGGASKPMKASVLAINAFLGMAAERAFAADVR